MRKKTIVNSIVVILTFLLAINAKRLIFDYYSISITSDYLKVINTYLWWLIPPLIVLAVLYGFNKIPNLVGLNKGLLFGFIFSVITVSPMLISSAVIGKISADFNLFDIIHKTVLAGFMEEFLFRGFLFGILFRKLGWGFIPASILGGVLFGIGHLYQGSTFTETIGVFLVTSIGAIWFSWLYIEWKNNLWVPIFLHILMNLSWVLFKVSDNALGGSYTNIFRILTIALTIFITIRYNKKNGLKINRMNLLVNKKGEENSTNNN